jgi:aspartate/methionine/tyrosine aminotransferase
MNIETFELERNQSLYENEVPINLTESGLHPWSLNDVLNADEVAELLTLPLGYGYTNGDPELRAQIAASYRLPSAANVLVTNGSAEANFVAMWGLLEAGDDVIYMVPNYLQIRGLARSLGVRVLEWPLVERAAWAPDLDALDAMMTPKTRMIVVCNPNNPTGAVLSDDAMRRIARIAARVGCYVYCDEIYRGSELDGHERRSMIEFYDKAIVAGGLSKALGFPGLRIGWLAGPADVIEEAWRRHDYTTISTGIPSQYVAKKVLEPQVRARFLEHGRAVLRGNLATVQTWLEPFRDRIRLVPPRAGGMAFLGYDAPVNSTLVATRLREEHGVFVVAGDWFGMDGYLRIGIGVAPDMLARGLERIDATLRELLQVAR